MLIAILVIAVILVLGISHRTIEDNIREKAEELAYDLSDRELEMMIDELIRIKEERER